MSYTPNPVPQDVESLPAFLSMELGKLADSPVDGVPGPKGDAGPQGPKGDPSQSQFTSFVFKRATSTPVTPTGGSYGSPVPSGWSDGIPTGTDPIYSSTRIFTTDGLYPQVPNWSTPVLFVQNGQGGGVRYIFSSAVSAPTLPANSSTTGWNTTPDSTTIWLSQQINTVEVGGSIAAYGAWQPAVRIKGETGPIGTRGSGEFYTSGSSWVDATADSAVTAVYAGGKVYGDTVTISNGSSFAMTKYWNGSAWTAPGTVINGNLLVDGTVSAAKVITNGLTIKDPSGNIILDAGGSSNNIDFSKIFGSTKPANNATVGADGSNLSISTSGNMMPNSDFQSGIQNWILTWNAGGGTNYAILHDLAGADYSPTGSHTLGVVRNGTTLAASSWFDVTYDHFFPCTGSQLLEISAYVSSQHCSRTLLVSFYDVAYGYVSDTWHTGSTPDNGGQQLSNWDRVGAVFTTPPTCRYIKFVFRLGAASAVDPYAWITKIFFGIAKPGQTQLSPWSAATASGAFAELSQITGSNSTTYIANAAIKNALIENISADKITTGTLSASTNLTVGTAARSGTTMTGSGAVFEGTGGYFSLGNSTKNITFNGSAFYINGPVIATDNIVNGSVTSIKSVSKQANAGSTYQSIPTGTTYTVITNSQIIIPAKTVTYDSKIHILGSFWPSAVAGGVADFDWGMQIQQSLNGSTNWQPTSSWFWRQPRCTLGDQDLPFIWTYDDTVYATDLATAQSELNNANAQANYYEAQWIAYGISDDYDAWQYWETQVTYWTNQIALINANIGVNRPSYYLRLACRHSSTAARTLRGFSYSFTELKK